ncbi:bud site selection protein [Chamberlinius hualienensis]
MATISKEDYLKRYLSKDEAKKKKKSKKLKAPASSSNKKCMIVDDDIDLKMIGQDEDFYVEMGDEAPEVIGFVDDRPEELRRLEELKAGKWKTVGDDSSKLQELVVANKWKISANKSSSRRSPLRKAEENEDKRHSDTRNSPKHNKRQRHDSDSDSDSASPSRADEIGGGGVDDSDQSPPRQTNRSDSDNSPPRRRSKASESDSDQSPPRLRNQDDDLSHPLTTSSSSRKILTKTLDGRKAGLQNAKALKEEIELLKERERRQFEKMDSEISGKNAATIVRDRATGKRRNLEEEEKQKALEREIQAKRDAKYKQWGKGLKQLEMQKSKLEDDIKEVDKPLARYEGDADLEKMLKEQERDGDPMLAFIQQKKRSKNPGNDLPKYNGAAPPPPNRFNILPGYRWDGVDRSNGFEKARYTRQSNKIAIQDEAYKWSVEDM